MSSKHILRDKLRLQRLAFFQSQPFLHTLFSFLILQNLLGLFWTLIKKEPHEEGNLWDESLNNDATGIDFLSSLSSFSLADVAPWVGEKFFCSAENLSFPLWEAFDLPGPCSSEALFKTLLREVINKLNLDPKKQPWVEKLSLLYEDPHHCSFSFSPEFFLGFLNPPYDPLLEEIPSLIQRKFRLLKHSPFQKENNLTPLGGYYPLLGEVNILSLRHTLSQIGFHFYLPRTTEQGIAFSECNDLQHLRRSKLGVLEPVSRETFFPPLILVPGLAFDKKGYRLGFGGGFYDRYLAHHPALKIGVCFNFQIQTDLPIDSYDIPCDLIVTEKGFLYPT